MDASAPFCPNCTGLFALAPATDGGLRCPNCKGAYQPESAIPTGQWSGPPPEVDTSSWPFSGEFLSRYKPVRFLGRGGMGAVYLMRQAMLDRLVAVKVVRDGPLTTEETDRLQREARILARLQHPAILTIHDVAFDYSLPCMISEYVDGETLGPRLRRDPPMTLPAAMDLMVEVLEGLAVAHQAGIIHRDLKPDNIFLTSGGRPKIGDFGLARAENANSGASIGVVVGTPQYMSPEQCCGERAVAASDLYSVGVMLYAITTGQLPFVGPDLPSYLYQHVRQTPVSPAALNPWLPESLVRIILRTLAKNPQERYANARELANALRDSRASLNPQDNARRLSSNPTPPALSSLDKANVVDVAALRSLPSGPRPPLRLSGVPTSIKVPWEQNTAIPTTTVPAARPTRWLTGSVLVFLAALAYLNVPQVRVITHAVLHHLSGLMAGLGNTVAPTVPAFAPPIPLVESREQPAPEPQVLRGDSAYCTQRQAWIPQNCDMKAQYGKMGCQLERQGNLSGALEYYRKAWQLDPNCRPLNERIARVEARLAR